MSSASISRDNLSREPTVAKNVNFSYLPTDLITLIGHYCSVAKLVLLRRLSHHWSHASRLPQAWKFSEWTTQPVHSKKNLLTIIQSAPYLRGLTLPATVFIDYQQLTQLIHLERVVYHEPPIYMPVAWTQLQHIQVNESDSGVIRSQAPQNYLTLADSPIGLVSLVVGVKFGSLDCFHEVFTQLLAGRSKDTLISISILAQNLKFVQMSPNDFHFDWAPFTSLEQLQLSLCDMLSPYHNPYSAIASAPKLRILTLTAYVFGQGMESLLQQAEFNRRLEYLHLIGVKRSFGRGDVGFDPVWFHRLMNQCTSLLVFRVTGWHIRFRPLTLLDWSERLESSSNDLFQMEMELSESSFGRFLEDELTKNNSSQRSRNADPTTVEKSLTALYQPHLPQLSCGHLFAGHPAVRSSLRVLEFDCMCFNMWCDNQKQEEHQLRVQFSVRFPHLLHLRFVTPRISNQIVSVTDTRDDPVRVSEVEEVESWLTDQPPPSASTATSSVSHKNDISTVAEGVGVVEQEFKSMQISSSTSTTTNHTIAASSPAPATSSSATSSTDFVTRGELSQSDQALLNTSPFAYVRAIKQLIGRPLQQSELTHTRL